MPRWQHFKTQQTVHIPYQWFMLSDHTSVNPTKLGKQIYQY